MTLPKFFDILFRFGFLGNYLFEGEMYSRVIDIHPIISLITIALAGIGILAAGYLLGSLNFSIIISAKAYKQDIRNY